jgi:HD-GYP domain-containing protein (c-di-GMP phosphodiesterase class II)
LVRKLGRPLLLRELEDFPEVHPEVGRLAAAGLSLLVPASSGSEFCGLLALGDRIETKPVSRHEATVLEILGHSIATAIRNSEAFFDTQNTFFATVAELVVSLEKRYPYMSGHSQRVCEIALEMGRHLGHTETQLEALRWGALFHDLGELERYEELMQPGVRLSDDARLQLRIESAARSDRMLGERCQGGVRDILRHSAERWDGTGSPDRLCGVEIPLGARIVALADAWDALTHDRPHRAAHSRATAISMIEGRAGKQFDPDLVPLLLEVVQASDPTFASA